MKEPHRSLLVAALLAALIDSSCSQAPSVPPGETRAPEPHSLEAASATRAKATDRASEAAAPPIQRVLPYPRGRWRLAALEELDRVVLWFSHILIRYDGVLDANVSFSPVAWSSAYPPSTLSRDEALRRAQRVAHEAATRNVPFAELAAAYSEDITTAGRGGSLGGMTASMIYTLGQILDALAVLKPGQTSEVVETPHGFHILQKRAPPPEQTLSGAHIVIGHADAPTLRPYYLREGSPRRSRAEAESLAREVYERARVNPAEFPELVRRHSEHVDADAGGDLGSWSTREARAPAAEIETLAGLRVGEVAPPIETLVGFQILMRTPDGERPEFAHEAVELFYDPQQPADHADSEANVHRQALQVAARLRHEPHVFDALRTEFCCRDTYLWREGRREKSVSAALSALSIGEIGATPVRTPSSYAILRRLEPKRVSPAPAVAFELPSRVTPDVDAFLGRSLDSGTAAGLIRSLGTLAADEIGLRGERRTRWLELHEIRAGIWMGDKRLRDVAAIAEGTKALLDRAELEQYHAVAVRLIEQAVLAQRASVLTSDVGGQ